jgi:hypothetical protein
VREAETVRKAAGAVREAEAWAVPGDWMVHEAAGAVQEVESVREAVGAVREAWPLWW